MTKLNRRNFNKTLAFGAAAGLALPASVAQAQTVSGLYDNIPVKDDVLGNKDAAVTLLEYASMTCPHCKSFHERIFPAIKEKYIETGKVRFIMRPFPFDGDRRGEAAFMLAKCAPNDNYYAMVDALFATQRVWGGQGNPVPELLRIAKLSGMTEADFKACLGNQELLTSIIEGRNLAARKFNVRATPTLFINDQKYTSPNTVSALSEALDGVLGS